MMHRQHQRRQRGFERGAARAPARSLAALADAAPDALEVHDDRHRERHQQARHDGGDEQRADRHGRERAVDDEPEARRNHVGEDRGRAGERDAERLRIAAPPIAGTMVLAIAAASAVDEPETPPISVLVSTLTCPSPPRKWPTSVRRERDQLLGDAADIHHAGRQHEERDREQQVVERIGHALRHGQQRELALRQERHEGAEHQRVDDRHAEQHQADRHDDQRPDHAERADQRPAGRAFEREIERDARGRDEQAARRRRARPRSARAPARRARSPRRPESRDRDRCRAIAAPAT